MLKAVYPSLLAVCGGGVDECRTFFFSVWIAKRFWGTRFSPVRIVDKTRHRLLLFVCLSVGLRQKVLVLVSLVLVDTK